MGLLVHWAALLSTSVAILGLAPGAHASGCSRREMYVVAHEDDSLLFQSPDLLHAVRARACVTTVYVTAGDAGNGRSAWTGREAGANSGYASMAGVADGWTRTRTAAAGHRVTTYTLRRSPNVVQVFLRLPDGGPAGAGFGRYGFESLQGLWTGQLADAHPVDGSAAYSSRALVSTLAALMTAFRPQVIRVQDYVGGPGDGDHSDHHYSAYFARAAQRRYAARHSLTAYEGYPAVDRPGNVTGADLTGKQDAFYAYARGDPKACGFASDCRGTHYAAMLERQYTLDAWNRLAP